MVCERLVVAQLGEHRSGLFQELSPGVLIPLQCDERPHHPVRPGLDFQAVRMLLTDLACLGDALRGGRASEENRSEDHAEHIALDALVAGALCVLDRTEQRLAHRIPHCPGPLDEGDREPRPGETLLVAHALEHLDCSPRKRFVLIRVEVS